MTLYTHTTMPGTYGNKGVRMPDGVYHPRSWFRTASEQELTDAGFTVYVSPEPEPPTVAERQTAKLAALANKRWQVETGGITINTIPIRTDEVGQAKITGAIALFDNDPTLTTVDWEAQPGIWVTLDGATIRTIGVAVGRHIQACFSHARTLSEAIQAATDMSALDAIDIETGWPGQAE